MIAHCFRVWDGRVICEKCGDEKRLDPFRSCPFPTHLPNSSADASSSSSSSSSSAPNGSQTQTHTVQVEYVNGIPFITSTSLEMLKQLENHHQESNSIRNAPSPSGHVLLQHDACASVNRDVSPKDMSGIVTPADLQNDSPMIAKMGAGNESAKKRSAPLRSANRRKYLSSKRRKVSELDEGCDDDIVNFVTAPPVRPSQPNRNSNVSLTDDTTPSRTKSKKKKNWKGWLELSTQDEVLPPGLLERDVELLGDPETRTTRSSSKHFNIN